MVVTGNRSSSDIVATMAAWDTAKAIVAQTSAVVERVSAHGP